MHDDDGYFDERIAADRLVHHAEVLVLRGDSYRLKDKGKEVMGSEDGG